MEIRQGQFRAKSDEYQWMFQEFEGTYIDKKTGKEKERWDTWGYYATLEQLVSAVSQRFLRRSDGDVEQALSEMLRTLTPLVRRLSDAQQELHALLTEEVH